jgi:hypothetical protein
LGLHPKGCFYARAKGIFRAQAWLLFRYAENGSKNEKKFVGIVNRQIIVLMLPFRQPNIAVKG